jgi:hypothetical protein
MGVQEANIATSESLPGVLSFRISIIFCAPNPRMVVAIS